MHCSTSVTTRLTLIGTICFLFLSIPAGAQLYRGHCSCEDIPATQRGYVNLASEEEAIELVKGMLVDMKRYAHIRFNETIQVKETLCAIPSALICGRRAERFITYNNGYIERVTREKGKKLPTWIDLHILAHEIGHHVLGHLDSKNPFIKVEKIYEQEVVGKTGVQARAKYVDDIDQVKEFEADFFGLWLLARTKENFPFRQFITGFDTAYVHSSEKENAPLATPTKKKERPGGVSEATGSHPLFGDRLRAMQQFWNKLQNDRITLARASYFSSAASAAYVDLNRERTFWDLGFVGGLTVAGKPVFSVDGQSVDALLYPFPKAFNLYTGLAVSRFKWFSPWRYEAEIAYSTQRYGTLLSDNNLQRLLESFDIRYLTVFPKITWSPLGRKNTQFVASRFNFFVSAGPSLHIPLGIDYQNYAATVASPNRPSLQLSVSPRVSLGIELLKKTLLPRAYKLALTYEPLWIRLNTTPRPKALSHNLDLTLQYSFARW